jgi:septum site-determining protein MinC
MWEMEENPKVRIKGIREGLLITLDEESWPKAQAALLDYVENQADFLRGGRLILDIGNHILRAAELGQLRDTLSEQGLTLWAVLSASPITQQNAQTLGLATRLNKPTPERATPPLETALSGEQAVLFAAPCARASAAAHRSCDRYWRRQSRKRDRCGR